MKLAAAVLAASIALPMTMGAVSATETTAPTVTATSAAPTVVDPSAPVGTEDEATESAPAEPEGSAADPIPPVLTDPHGSKTQSFDSEFVTEEEALAMPKDHWTLITYTGVGDLTVQAEPRTMGSDIAIVKAGDLVETGPMLDNYYAVKTASGAVGWLYGVQAAWTWPKAPELTRDVTIPDAVKVYSGPHTEYMALLGELEAGAQTRAGEVYSFEGGGAFSAGSVRTPVQMPDGTVGWVDADAVIAEGGGFDGAPAVAAPVIDGSSESPVAEVDPAETSAPVDTAEPVPSPAASTDTGDTGETAGFSIPPLAWIAALVILGAMFLLWPRKKRPTTPDQSDSTGAPDEDLPQPASGDLDPDDDLLDALGDFGGGQPDTADPDVSLIADPDPDDDPFAHLPDTTTTAAR